MPCFKTPEYGLKFAAVGFAQQIVPGSFEHALCFLVDSGELDLSALEARVRNDRCGAPSHSDRMKERIDSPTGRQMIARRFATVEPVFANLRHNKGLNRFTLRGKRKVDGQWKLFCLVHNIERLAHHGYAQ